MPLVELTTLIAAPIERCFDLARNIDLHVSSMSSHGERAVAGVTSGLIGPDQEVTWEARHFLVRQLFTSRITGYERPRYFQDSMVRGAFSSFVHDHLFEASARGTVMKDRLSFRSPFGPLGAVVDRLVLRAYLERLLKRRNESIKQAAEGTGRPTPRHPPPARA